MPVKASHVPTDAFLTTPTKQTRRTDKYPKSFLLDDILTDTY